MGPRLGVVLFQLPPSFRADLKLLEVILEKLPAGKKFTFEFRHPSWDNPDTLRLLEKAGVALCNAETRIVEGTPVVTAPHAYIRVRQEPPYSEEELNYLRKKIEQGIKEAEDLYVHIKHDMAGLAPEVAMQLQSRYRGTMDDRSAGTRDDKTRRTAHFLKGFALAHSALKAPFVHRPSVYPLRAWPAPVKSPYSLGHLGGSRLFRPSS